MKKIICLVLLLTFCFNVNSQNSKKYGYEVIYNLNFQPDSTDASTTQKNIHFTLLIGDKISIYAENNKIKLDSILNGIESGNINQNYVLGNLNSMPKPFTQAKILKYFDKQEIIYNDNLSSQNYEYTEDLKIGKWKILDNKKNIKGYDCHSAEIEYGGRKYTAYYTDQIPIQDGPYKFNGLPGLIISISDSKGFFQFELIGLKKIDSFNFKLLKSIGEKINVSKKEFYKLRENYMNNPIPFMEQEGAVFDDNNKKLIRDIFSKKRKKNNNPIELTY